MFVLHSNKAAMHKAVHAAGWNSLQAEKSWHSNCVLFSVAKVGHRGMVQGWTRTHRQRRLRVHASHEARRRLFLALQMPTGTQMKNPNWS
jgi:hypothetical protein